MVAQLVQSAHDSFVRVPIPWPSEGMYAIKNAGQGEHGVTSLIAVLYRFVMFPTFSNYSPYALSPFLTSLYLSRFCYFYVSTSE